ncbi:sulfatase-like hydrolase/transferase [Verrucomicrobiaceae bacterium N1E253]|uniref:Sulfatase-like hydrolase/transferase n=1 Tax=Oceaniferula marina TaxID=2748318 RepID=A0A851GID4_9BACT|nr:sulfatase-like hydrolase/transferase [Oceaniferula marina]NWK57116.1 sulfatase-like hydrolase/transferase [Oceaniferula marina]
MPLNETGIHLGVKQHDEPLQVAHIVAWFGGILCALVPFIWAWEVGSMQIPVRFGSGNMGFNLLIVTGLCLLGSVVGGYWWRYCKFLLGARDSILTWASVSLLILGLAGCFFVQVHAIFFYLVAALLLVTLVLSFLYREQPLGGRPKLEWAGFSGWLKNRSPWNAVFFFVLFVALLANNLTLVASLDLSVLGKVQVFIGRFFTQGVFVGICCLLAELVVRATPRGLKWSPWLVFGLLPLLVIADQLLGIMWSRPLIHTVNAMTQSGSFQPEVELKTSGLEVGAAMAWCIVIGIWLSGLLLAGGCWFVSKRFQTHMSVRSVLAGVMICWVVVLVEQGVGALWMDVTDRQAEYKAFDFHPGLFSPPEGVGAYQVAFRQPRADMQVEIPSLDHKPDVFVFMLESTRGDAIRPEVAPFLSRLREEECQVLSSTWAGSNATHLSWYSFFHSQVPVFWRDDLESIPDRSAYAGAMPLQYLKRAGYEIEVRAVCDLSYKDFGLSNFGAGTNLASVVVQADDANIEFSNLGIAERERQCFEQLRSSVLSRPDGGGFYFTALDSPHYNYYWHDDFDPPFTEFDEDTRFPLNPSEDEVQRVLNRYWNAVAWVDFQIADFCAFLKEQGRYDESIIIVVGDHGEEFQEQGSWFHCSSLQPEQTSVPILIKWPQSMGRGPEQSTACHLDVMPSLFHALGLPEQSRRGMVGRNLWTGAQEATAISTTAYAGQSGETMRLRRGAYEAVFSWEKYWEARVPEEMVLEQLRGPDGEIRLSDAGAYEAELRRLFPDAFERFFEHLEVRD